jgi:hypothetical protein
MKLIIEDVTRPPTGREGEMWGVDLQVNGLPRLRRDLFSRLMAKEVQVEGSDVLYTVKGIGLFGTPDDGEHSKAGLWVQEIRVPIKEGVIYVKGEP